MNKYKVAKHFQLNIREEDRFRFSLLESKVAEEAALDGVYVIRTSVARERLGTDDTVRTYKQLSQVERAFRSLKTMDLKVRPIYHRMAKRVRAHIFLCMLADYVEWHMLEAWRELLYSDEDQEAKKVRDPVAPAERSEGAERKARTRRLADGTEVYSFQTLLKDLSAIVRNDCRRKTAPEGEPVFTMTTIPNDRQQRALALANEIVV